MADTIEKPMVERLAGLELSPMPVWLLDPEELRIVWANDAALELFRATDRADLYSRSFRGASKALMTRFDTTIAAVREGKRFWDEWTFYPKGQPIRVQVHFTPFALDDGRIGALQQGVMPTETDPTRLRGVEALMLTSIVVALVDFEAKVVMKNPAASHAFGTHADDWRGWFVRSDDADEMLAEGATGELSCREVAVRTTEGERFHSIELRPVRDAVTGTMMALVHQTDQTARRGAEAEAEKQARLAAELDRTLSLLEAQKREILTLSAPLLDIGERALAVPIIGELDAARSADVSARLLPAIGARQARVVILDLTGAASLDGAGAEHLLRVVQAIRLLGARPILTGIRPALARSLVESGFDAGRLPILRSLSDGIRLVKE